MITDLPKTSFRSGLNIIILQNYKIYLQNKPAYYFYFSAKVR